MTQQDVSKRCAHAGCTCHTQDGAQYCSEACRSAAERGGHAEGCRCGHAGCTASDYVVAPVSAAGK